MADFVLLAFADNGFGSTVQKAEGLALGSDGTHLFMITAPGIRAAVMLALSLFSPDEHGRSSDAFSEFCLPSS